MRIAIILNGISLRKKFLYHEIFPALDALFEVEVFETNSHNHGFTLASKACDQQFDYILAAGGDGTVHQVINGVLHGRENAHWLPTLGIIPIGSGNDFARSLNLKDDPTQLLELIKNPKSKKVDVGKIIFSKPQENGSTERYFLNEVDIGMGPEVVKKVLASGRPFGAGVSYYLSILSTFISYNMLTAKITTPDWSWEGRLRTLAIMNGNYYGHGLCIAPDAKPDDGKLSTFICGDVSVFDFIRFSGDLKKRKKVNLADVLYNETTSAELSAENPCLLEADGELVGVLPAKIEVLRQRIPMLF